MGNCSRFQSHGSIIDGKFFGHAENVIVQPAANRTLATTGLILFGYDTDPSNIYDTVIVGSSVGPVTLNLFSAVPAGVTLTGSLKNITQTLYDGNAIISAGALSGQGGSSMAVASGDQVLLMLFVSGSSAITIPRLEWYTS